MLLSCRRIAFRAPRVLAALASTHAEDRVVRVEPLDGEHRGIVVVGMNRPDAKNALSRQFLRHMKEAMETVKSDRAARVVILRSLVPGIFSAGADLKERSRISPTEFQDVFREQREMIASFDGVRIPLIAAMDGHALGGGLEMALACDIRVSSDDAKMGLVEAKWAIIPGLGGTQRLPRLVGIAKAKEMLFTAQVLAGREAKDIGLVNHSVPQNGTSSAAYDRALEISKAIFPNGPLGVKLAKKAISRGFDVDLHTGMAIEEACYQQTIPTKDRMEGMVAFREKRSPRYTGE